LGRRGTRRGGGDDLISGKKSRKERKISKLGNLRGTRGDNIDVAVLCKTTVGGRVEKDVEEIEREKRRVNPKRDWETT